MHPTCPLHSPTAYRHSQHTAPAAHPSFTTHPQENSVMLHAATRYHCSYLNCAPSKTRLCKTAHAMTRQTCQCGCKHGKGHMQMPVPTCMWMAVQPRWRSGSAEPVPRNVTFTPAALGPCTNQSSFLSCAHIIQHQPCIRLLAALRRLKPDGNSDLLKPQTYALAD